MHQAARYLRLRIHTNHLISGILSFLAASHAFAETADKLASLDLEKLMELPVETVSGVSKYEQSIRQAPASVTVLTAADIRNYGWRTLSDALRTAPGFHIRNDRFYEYVGNRGYTRAFDYNSRTLVLINGHRVNDPIYQMGAIGTDFLLDPDLIERIEIIRGPGSSVYGSSAFYGAINIIPKQGRDLAGGQAALALGSSPDTKGRVSFGDRTPAGVEYLFSATVSDSHGESGFTLPDSWRTATGRPDAKTSSEDGTRQQQLYARASYRGFETEAAYGSREKDVLPNVYNTYPGAHAADTRAYWLARASGHVQPDATLEAKTSIDYYAYDGHFNPEGYGFHRFNPTASSVSLNHELRYHQTFTDGHSLLLGTEIQNNLRLKTTGNDLDDPSQSLLPVNVSSSYVSPFAQFDYQLLAPLRISLGGRYDSYSTGEDRFTPRTGLIWDATRATTLKLLYGESFRVPNLEERYPTEPGSSANPDLRPEINRSWELVAEHQLSPIWSADAHLYHTRSIGLIINYANSTDYTTTGTELGLNSHLTNGILIRTSGTWQNTRDESTGSHAADSPHLLGKLNVSAPVYSDWLRASTELQYVSKRDDFAGSELGEYLTANLTLRAAPLWRSWSASISLYNIADAHWSEATNDIRITTPPRSVVLRITRDF